MTGKYIVVIEALERLKFKYPADSVDRVFNMAIDAAIRKVLLIDSIEAIEKEIEMLNKVNV
jgi:hypothetical protein